MLRLIILLLFITAVSLGVAWIADEPGRVVIDWGSYHIETSLLVIMASIATLALLCTLIYWLLYTLIHTPRYWMRSQLAKRQALGLTALTNAFAAIATQDIRTAKKQIGRAQQYLPHQPLTLMLSAQVARLEGNEPQARLHFEQMLKSEGTEFLAMRGLIENARRNHDDKLALSTAEKAITLKPQDEWLIITLVGLYTKANRTQDALRLLEQSARKRYITGQESRTLSAYTLFENARALAEQNRWEFTITVLEDALRKMPGFAPATALLAKAYLKQNEIKRALKAIEAAWKIAPHPALTEALFDCYEHDEERKKVVYTIEKLAAHSPENRESQFLLAGLALKKKDVTAARGYAQHLITDKETMRACALMAEVETASDNSEHATRWLKRMASAASDPTWECETCKHTTDIWHLTCGQCGSIDSLEWK